MSGRRRDRRSAGGSARPRAARRARPARRSADCPGAGRRRGRERSGRRRARVDHLGSGHGRHPAPSRGRRPARSEAAQEAAGPSRARPAAPPDASSPTSVASRPPSRARGARAAGSGSPGSTPRLPRIPAPSHPLARLGGGSARTGPQRLCANGVDLLGMSVDGSPTPRGRPPADRHTSRIRARRYGVHEFPSPPATRRDGRRGAGDAGDGIGRSDAGLVQPSPDRPTARTTSTGTRS